MLVRVHTSVAKVRNSGKNPSIRNRNIYVAIAHNSDQYLADIRQAREYWHMGVADARYQGPRSRFGRLLAEAKRLVALLAAREAGTATAEEAAELDAYGAPHKGWPGAAAAIAARRATNLERNLNR